MISNKLKNFVDDYTLKNKQGYFVALFFLFFACFLVFGDNARASDVLSFEVDACNYANGINLNGQGSTAGNGFIAENNNTSRVSLKMYRFGDQSDCGNVRLSIYSDIALSNEIASSTLSSLSLPGFNTYPNINGSLRDWITFDFSSPIPLNVGESYYWLYSNEDCFYHNICVDLGNPYNGGYLLGNYSDPPARDTSFKIYYDDEYEPEDPFYVDQNVYNFYQSGGYNIPQSINCYGGTEYCSMVFGYDIGVFSRSIASTSPDMPNYPRFSWWWPNTLASTPTASSTIRQFIDWGFTDNIVNFSFDIPTSTTDYVLEISDPLNPDIGSSTSFVVHVNLIGSSSSIIADTCLGTCDLGILGEVFCGLKNVVCWAFTPSNNSLLYIKQNADKIKTKFPFNIVFDITDTFKDAMTITADTRTAGFSIPFIRTTSTGSEYYMLEILNASSTENAIGKDNSTLFRSSILWVAYILSALGVLTILLKKK